jgi:hypothetical protein
MNSVMAYGLHHIGKLKTAAARVRRRRHLPRRHQFAGILHFV